MQFLQGQLRCLDGSHVPQNSGSTVFHKKNVLLLKIIGPVTPLWVLYPSEIMHMGFTELLLARAVFARSIKVLGWQPGGPKSREHAFPKKNVLLLKIIGPVTPPWVLYPCEIVHMGSTELFLAGAMFARSNKVSGWQPGAPKSREHDFPKKKCPDFFEIHRTSETSMGTSALGNHAYGLYGTFTSQINFYKVN